MAGPAGTRVGGDTVGNVLGSGRVTGQVGAGTTDDGPPDTTWMFGPPGWTWFAQPAKERASTPSIADRPARRGPLMVSVLSVPCPPDVTDVAGRCTALRVHTVNMSIPT